MSYYGCDRLVSMCEKALADQLVASHPGIAADVHKTAELAPRLLILALESGLGKLEANALNHVSKRWWKYNCRRIIAHNDAVI